MCGLGRGSAWWWGCAWRWGWRVAMAGWGWWSGLRCTRWASFDAQMAAQMVRRSSRRCSAGGAEPPVPAEMLAFVQSPEFRAGMMLAGYALLAAGAAGGVDGGRGVCRVAEDAARDGVRDVARNRHSAVLVSSAATEFQREMSDMSDDNRVSGGAEAAREGPADVGLGD